MDKIQVGKKVWIKPNRGQSVPKEGHPYYVALAGGTISRETWLNYAVDFAFLQVGNFFPTREAAEAAIIKPVDSTPITYEQWVKAGRPSPWVINGYGEPCVWLIGELTPGIVFGATKCWLTREAAQAWLDKWNAEHRVKE